MDQIIAFFGATGGCANSCLAYSLQNGYTCSALARNPEKLKSMLQEQGITDDIIAQKLTIVKGNIQETDSINEVITGNGTHSPASVIISGIGGAPTLQYSLTAPITLDNPNICTEFTKNLLSAMYKLKKSDGFNKMLLAVVSTTGITKGPDDLPFGYHILYQYFLKVAHADKAGMEDLLHGAGIKEIFSRVVIIRPTLLTGSHLIGKENGYCKLKVGTDSNPIAGYSISRADVGEWIFQNCIKKGNSNTPGLSTFTLTS